MSNVNAAAKVIRMGEEMNTHRGGSNPDPIPANTGKAGTSADLSDEALLIAVGNRQSTEAFNELFHRFAKRLFALGMKLTRNEQLANDLVQEAFLTVWRKAPLYDLDRGNAQGWIFTLARNRCFDMLRKQKRQPSTINADDIWPIDGELEQALVNEDQGMQTVEVSRIESLYDELPDAQRAVVEQIYIHDRTHEEAAEVLDIPLGTLKSRLRLAMGKLRDKIGIHQDD
jgi:RNA polymerase sigma-70 factor (ECF subfamily)